MSWGNSTWSSNLSDWGSSNGSSNNGSSNGSSGGGWGESNGFSFGDSGWGNSKSSSSSNNSSNNSSGGWNWNTNNNNNNNNNSGNNNNHGTFNNTNSNSNSTNNNNGDGNNRLGTKGYVFKPFSDIQQGKRNYYQSICCLKEFASKSPEELRFEDIVGKSATTGIGSNNNTNNVSNNNSGWNSWEGDKNTNNNNSWSSGNSNNNSSSGWSSNNNNNNFGQGDSGSNSNSTWNWSSNSGNSGNTTTNSNNGNSTGNESWNTAGGWSSNSGNNSSSNGGGNWNWSGENNSSNGTNSNFSGSSSTWNSNSNNNSNNNNSSSNSGRNSTGNSSSNNNNNSKDGGWNWNASNNDSGNKSNSSSNDGWNWSSSNSGGNSTNNTNNSNNKATNSSSDEWNWNSSSSSNNSNSSKNSNPNNSSNSNSSSDRWNWDSASSSSTGDWSSSANGSSNSSNSSNNNSGSAESWNWSATNGSSSSSSSTGGWESNQNKNNSNDGWSFASSDNRNSNNGNQPIFAAYNQNPYQIDLSIGLKAFQEKNKSSTSPLKTDVETLALTPRKTSETSSRTKNPAHWSGRKGYGTVIKVTPRSVTVVGNTKPTDTPNTNKSSLLTKSVPHFRSISLTRATNGAQSNEGVSGGQDNSKLSNTLAPAVTHRNRSGTLLSCSGTTISPLSREELIKLNQTRVQIHDLHFDPSASKPEKTNTNLFYVRNQDLKSNESLPPTIQNNSKEGIIENFENISNYSNQNRETIPTKQLYPKLTKAEYYCVPSIEEMKIMTVDELKRIKNFTIGHEKFGKVTFPGETDVRGIDLDKVVTIEWRAIQVYKSDDLDKPAVGKGLNRYAEIELYQIFPSPPPNTDSNWKPTRESMQRWSSKLMELCAQDKNTTFDSFDLNEGIWRFHVGHWTTYGITDYPNQKTITLSDLPSSSLPIHTNNDSILLSTSYLHLL